MSDYEVDAIWAAIIIVPVLVAFGLFMMFMAVTKIARPATNRKKLKEREWRQEYEAACEGIPRPKKLE